MYKMGACVIAHKVSCRTHSVWTILPVQIIFNFYVRLAGTFSNICQIMGYFNLFDKRFYYQLKTKSSQKTKKERKNTVFTYRQRRQIYCLGHKPTARLSHCLEKTVVSLCPSRRMERTSWKSSLDGLFHIQHNSKSTLM